jgi:hypothetical protein
MVGILDDKKRVLDSLITREGRKQIVGGDLRVRFAAFSDRNAFYQGDIISGSNDASDRLYFEATSMPQDRVTFEADDSGKLLPLGSQGDLNVFSGKIISGSQAAGTRTFITASNIFASLSNDLLSGSFKNFNKLRIIGTEDLFREDSQFIISNKNIDFTITDEAPIKQSDIQQISVDKIESFFADKRMSHIKNFQYLPPRNQPTLLDPEGSLLGQFQPLSQLGILTFDQLKKDLQGRDFHTIDFSESSRENNIFAQLFEVAPNNVAKLDVIDFGIFPSDKAGENFHVFFAGKIYLDSMGCHTFVNLFTLVFE